MLRFLGGLPSQIIDTALTSLLTTHPCITQAWRIYRSLDVEYVFVVFGGLIGYPSDDINKFLWMVSWGRGGGGVARHRSLARHLPLDKLAFSGVAQKA
jgi:hypothetical protein